MLDVIRSKSFMRWEHAIDGTQASLHQKLAQAAEACSRANDPSADWRVWAFDVSTTTALRTTLQHQLMSSYALT